MTPAEREGLTLTADVLAHFRTVIVAERLRRGLSQETAAALVGVDRQTWNRWEAGDHQPQHLTAVVAVLRWLAADAPSRSNPPVARRNPQAAP